jgi:hypothetical protein
MTIFFLAVCAFVAAAVFQQIEILINQYYKNR